MDCYDFAVYWFENDRPVWNPVESLIGMVLNGYVSLDPSDNSNRHVQYLKQDVRLVKHFGVPTLKHICLNKIRTFPLEKCRQIHDQEIPANLKPYFFDQFTFKKLRRI